MYSGLAQDGKLCGRTGIVVLMGIDGRGSSALEVFLWTLAVLVG